MEYEAGGNKKEHASGIGSKAGLPEFKGKLWLWITLTVLFVCGVTATVAAMLGVIGASGGRDENKNGGLKGNAGVVAAYEFFVEQQEARESQTGRIAKEIGKRLQEEPFEIVSELNVDMDGLDLPGIPLSRASIGFDAKYDMKDLGVKVSALGMEVAAAYVIDNNVVVDVMGEAGSKAIDGVDLEELKGSMSLKDRLHALLPFLPKNDGLAMGLLEALAASVPDKYTKTEKRDVYSPRDDKTVSMDAVTTELDAAALKEVLSNLKQYIENDKKLSRNIQQMFDTFTGFMGIEAVTVDEGFKSLDEALESGSLSRISWSVYKRDGEYAGISFVCSGSDVSVDYTYMSEFSGNDNFTNIKADINGIPSQNRYRSSWQGDKLTLEGDTSSDSLTQNISIALEFFKEGGEYSVVGEMDVDADVSGITNSADNKSFDMEIDAEIRIGEGLGTLKETRWSDIYEKDWGKLEDMFIMFAPGQGIFNFGNTGDSL
ncbi:MAG: hypothetical protein ACM3S4_05190 [Burkholderiales bacterium]